MKYIQSAIVIAALLGGSEAVRIGQTNTEFEGMPISIAQTYHSSFAEHESKLKGKSEAELFAMVDAKIKGDKERKGEPEKEGSKETAVAKDAEAKALEKMVAEKLYGRIYGYPYSGYGYHPYYPVRYPYAPDIAGHVAAVAAYHDIIMRQEAANAILGLVAPSAGVALDLLNDAAKAGREARKDASDDKKGKKDDKPGDKSDL